MKPDQKKSFTVDHSAELAKWPSYEEALAKIQDRDCRYVRVGNHSATSKEQLDELYQKIKPAKEDGTYGMKQEHASAAEYRKAYLEASGGAIALLGQGVESDSASAAKIADLTAKLEQTLKLNSELVERVQALEESLTEPTEKDKNS